MTTPQVPREEIAAAVSARREMSREYDDAFVESIVDRVNETIDARLGPQQVAANTQREIAQARGERAVTITVACVSLGVSIPLTGIALGTGYGLPALLIVWIGIALVNLSTAIRSRRT